jgi:transcriptional regulator
MQRPNIRIEAMYLPPAFKETELPFIHETIRSARLGNFVTCTASGLICTPLPMLLDEREGEQGVLYGHVAKANPQWKETSTCEALAIFNGPDAYVTPSWYASKQEHGRVVPTWNYAAVHVYGVVEFFEDADRLHQIVTRLTDLYERPRAESWAVTDAPVDFIKAQLRGIVGLRMPISRIDAKRKMSQNRSEADRAGVAAGLAQSDRPSDRAVAGMIPG